MRTSRIAALAIMACMLGTATGRDQTEYDPGATFLMVWPSARSTALAGAMTALADDAEGERYNPAGLAFQTDYNAQATYARLLPSQWRNMLYTYGAASGQPVKVAGLPLHLGVNLQYFQLGQTDSGLGFPYYYCRRHGWRGAYGATAATQLNGRLGVGLGLKVITATSEAVDEGFEHSPAPYVPELGIDYDANGTTVAADLGVLWRPLDVLSFGTSIQNLGPDLASLSGFPARLPQTWRIGLCWTPLDSRLLRLRMMPEGVAIINWSTESWFSFGVEATVLEVVTLRCAYLDDAAKTRGGFMLNGENGEVWRYSLVDVLTQRGLGKLRQVGLCWGVGLNYKDYVRLDFGSDRLIYDYPTGNWKVTLAVPNLERVYRLFRQS
ncbi:MAG: hypothetical protein NTX53_18290 [candidate division WOR-3 bacterium]|nr:hypothetical protein [candidate division WOR-3 bacterium]